MHTGLCQYQRLLLTCSCEAADASARSPGLTAGPPPSFSLSLPLCAWAGLGSVTRGAIGKASGWRVGGWVTGHSSRALPPRPWGHSWSSTRPGRPCRAGPSAAREPPVQGRLCAQSPFPHRGSGCYKAANFCAWWGRSGHFTELSGHSQAWGQAQLRRVYGSTCGLKFVQNVSVTYDNLK